MQIKIFNIRLDKEHFEIDQNKVNNFLVKVKFKKSSTQLIEGRVSFWSIIMHYEEHEENFIESIENEKEKLSEEILTEDEKEIVAYFKQWRLDKSKEEMIPVYMILTNKTIFSLAKRKPKSLSDLDDIYGIGEIKKQQYGESLIALLNSI
jgi:superfamily II DNA helicase RecQ